MAKYKIGKITGPAGPVGPAGPGLPVGGVAGQILAKASATNYDTKWVEPASNPNLLDNWYFVNPINQRGQTEYTGIGYTIDRWYIATNGQCKVTIKNGHIKISGANGTYHDLRQRFENFDENKQYTLSILTTDGLYSNTSQKDNAAINNVPFPGGRCYLINENGWQVIIKIDSTNEKNVIAAKLELGDQQTLAYQDTAGNWVLNDPPPDPALELLKCQRYYRQDEFFTNSFKSTNDSYVRFVYNFQEMRAIPSVKTRIINTNSGASDIGIASVTKNYVNMFYDAANASYIPTTMHAIISLDANL